MLSRLYYLATPYSHPNAEVRECRFRLALEISTLILRSGRHVYSPIVHNHPIALRGDLGREWHFWRDYDLNVLRRCDVLLAARIDGWQESIGMKGEIEFAEQEDIPVLYVDYKSPADWRDKAGPVGVTCNFRTPEEYRLWQVD